MRNSPKSYVRCRSMRIRSSGGAVALCLPFFSIACLCIAAQAQDRLKGMPRYERYMRMRGDIASSVKRGTLIVSWQDGGKSFEFTRDGKTYRYDIATLK